MGGCISMQKGCTPVRPRLRRRRSGAMKQLDSKKNRVFGYHKVSKNVDSGSDDLDLDTPFPGLYIIHLFSLFLLTLHQSTIWFCNLFCVVDAGNERL